MPFVLGFASSNFKQRLVSPIFREKARKRRQSSEVHQEAKEALESSNISEQDDDDDFDIKKLNHPHAQKLAESRSSLGRAIELTSSIASISKWQPEHEIPAPVGRHETHMDIGVADGLHDSLMMLPRV